MTNSIISSSSDSMPINRPSHSAMDSNIPRKKTYFVELVKSLRKIGGESTENGEENPALSRARVEEVVPQGPEGFSAWMKPKEVRAAIRDNCSLIKTVKDPEQIAGIERRIKRIYENRSRGASTPETLQRYLERECDLEDWQAKRIVDDQMNKFDARANLERLRKQGVKLVRWCHGDCHEPRPYHIGRWDGHSGLKDGHPNALNGFVFDLDGPYPIIDEKRMIRGLPGDAINCHCHLEAVE